MPADASSHLQIALDGYALEPSRKQRRAEALHKYKQKRKVSHQPLSLKSFLFERDRNRGCSHVTHLPAASTVALSSYLQQMKKKKLYKRISPLFSSFVCPALLWHECNGKFDQTFAMQNLNFTKTIRYESRKQLAQARPRVKGQFVRNASNTLEASNPMEDVNAVVDSLTPSQMVSSVQTTTWRIFQFLQFNIRSTWTWKFLSKLIEYENSFEHLSYA